MDDQEQADIEASFSPTAYADKDFVDVNDWFDYEITADLGNFCLVLPGNLLQ